MERLIRLLSGSGAELSGETLGRLRAYRDMLAEWNQRMDLTSVPEEEIPLRHLGDSLLPVFSYPELFPSGASLADVGTGAGLPGLPIAIVRTDLQVTLIESMRKRCEFLSAVRETLGLPNVRILCVRAEEAGRDRALRERFDRTVSRAVAAAPVLLEYLLPLTKAGGSALCWKGPALRDELAQGTRAARILGGEAEEIIPAPIPGRDWEHLLLPIRKVKSTPKAYPRRSGTPGREAPRSGPRPPWP